jgi:hypothetical protein
MKETLQQIQSGMMTSWRHRSRLPMGEAGLLDTNYFQQRILRLVEGDRVRRPLREVPGIPPTVLNAFGGSTPAADALASDLKSFAEKTGLDLSEAISARRAVLGAMLQRPKADQVR